MPIDTVELALCHVCFSNRNSAVANIAIAFAVLLQKLFYML